MTGGFFAILDDIAILLDDAATMSKVAAKKTAGILGDDLAVNAEKATGFHASRELPVLWEITKGSFYNKLIILPLAFLLSAFLPALIVPVLLVGGMYLSYEGVESIVHMLFKHEHATPAAETTSDPEKLLKLERDKIKAAIRTDFILSIEIIIIALGTVINHPLPLQVLVVCFIALLATVGVYGLVALLVRMDDMGLYLFKKRKVTTGVSAWVLGRVGLLLIRSLPFTIRALGIIGTLAMLLVGGGMFTHNLEPLHHALSQLPQLLADLLTGLAIGALLVTMEKGLKKMKRLL